MKAPGKLIDRRKFIRDAALTSGAMLGASILTTASQGNLKLSPIKKAVDPIYPFKHSVASGDPLNSKVIIWTKITVDTAGPFLVKWFLSKEDRFIEIIESGEFLTDSTVDCTVKVDISGLSPSTTYFYQFILNDIKSPIGRVKTTASEGFDNIKLAVVSCNNYSAGYFNAFARIAERLDLDAVVHLGDYIYEGTQRKFAPQNNLPEDDYESTHFNRTRDWWLHYYRSRYSINRMDADLQAAHLVHPFITIWDDHEIANNACKSGARNHIPETDGDWEIRKSAARQAYAEWMPIRGDASKIYRSVKFGKMAELILLDTRLEGRDEQIYDTESPKLFAPERTMLGKDQKEWMFQQLDASTCQWKILANQVIFSEFNVKWANAIGPVKVISKELEETLLDYWEGYPLERDEVINHISKGKHKNVVILSASMHCALAFDVPLRAGNFSRINEKRTYDPVSGNGSVAVEFAAPSISSENFDEKMGSFYASTFESMINKKLPAPLGYNPNPHLKFADLQRHGYFLLNLTQERATANFYFVDSVSIKSRKETFAASWYTKSGKSRLEKSTK